MANDCGLDCCEHAGYYEVRRLSFHSTEFCLQPSDSLRGTADSARTNTQGDRDKVHADADARHREDIAMASKQRQVLVARQTEQLVALLEQNTQLTAMTKQMSERIEALTLELHSKFAQPGKSA